MTLPKHIGSPNRLAEAWQRLALVSGWSVWNIGMQNEEIEKIKEELKSLNKKKKKKKPLRKPSDPVW